MADFPRHWVGSAYGTNHGNIYVLLEKEDRKIRGTVRFNDLTLGLAIYNVDGELQDSTLRLVGAPDPRQPTAEQLGKLEIVLALVTPFQMRGTWESALGTAGTVVLNAQAVGSVASSPSAFSQATTLYTERRLPGAINIDRGGVVLLVDELRRDFSNPTVGVVYRTATGRERLKTFDEFLVDPETSQPMRYCRFMVQEPEVEGFNRVVNVELDASGQNSILVQSTNKVWATGKAETLLQALRPYRSWLITNFKIFGTTGMTFAFLVVLFLYVPEYPFFWPRVIFLACVIAVMIAYGWAQLNFVPTALVSTSTRNNPVAGFVSAFWSWALGIVAASTSALLGAYLKGLWNL